MESYLRLGINQTHTPHTLGGSAYTDITPQPSFDVVRRHLRTVRVVEDLLVTWQNIA